MQKNEKKYLRYVNSCCTLSREEEVSFAIGIEKHLKKALNIIGYHRQAILDANSPERKIINSFESLQNISNITSIWPLLNSLCETLKKIPELQDMHSKLMIHLHKATYCRNQLIMSNLKHVISEAKKASNDDESLLDLIQDGTIGLIASTDKFDWRRGVRLMPYATRGINNAIRHSTTFQHDMIRLPPNITTILENIESVSIRAFQETGKKPSRQELALYLEVPETKIDLILEAAQKTILFDEFTENEYLHMVDTIEDENAENPLDASVNAALSEIMLDALKYLTDREQKVLRMCFGIGMNSDHTLEEVGKQFGVSRERIRQIEAKALRKLRDPFLAHAHKLRTFTQLDEIIWCTSGMVYSPQLLIERSMDNENLILLYKSELELFVDEQGELTHLSRSQLEHIRNTSVTYCEYASNILMMDWILNHRTGKIPYCSKTTQETYTLGFRVLLAQYVANGYALPADIALQWVLLYPDSRINHVDYYNTKEFKKLFVNRYHLMFGSGLVVRPSKLPLTIMYKPVKQSLPKTIPCDIQGLTESFRLKAPLRKLNALVDECIYELEPYFRYARYSCDSTWSNMILMPKDFIQSLPDMNLIREQLSEVCAGGLKLVSIRKLYSFLGEYTPTLLGKIQLEMLTIQLEKLGFGIAPDIHVNNIDLKAFSEVVIFPLSYKRRANPDSAYQRMEYVIQIGAIVVQMDMHITLEVEGLLHQKICNNTELSNTGKESLNAFLYWCLRTPQQTKSLNRNILKLSTTDRVAVYRDLASIIQKKSGADLRGAKQLEYLYGLLKINPKQIENAPNSDVATINEPINVSNRDAEPTFQIQYPPNTESRSNSFTLNKELIKKREEETRQVKILLENVFVDVDNEDKIPTSPIPVKKPSENLLERLDQTHRTLFRELVSHEVWERSDFLAKCRKLGLMVDGAMEVLNEWAFEKVDAALIEGGDPIYINADVAMELMNVK